MSLAALPDELKKRVSLSLGAPLTAFKFFNGSTFSHTGRVSTERGQHFVKWIELDGNNQGMYEAERYGLELLGREKLFHVPAVRDVIVLEDIQCILMELIVPATKQATYWQDTGRRLAAQHRLSNDRYGLDRDNFVGTIPQGNSWRKDWSTFFVDNRIAPLASRFDVAFRKRIDKLCDRLPGLIPHDPPALLHGDLWSGNLMADELGAPCLIDPAVYYGHREAEIAFTRMFGGFDPSFYGAYQEAYPLAPGHEDRTDLFNLYPLLVHAVLFGGSYLSQADGIIRRWI